MKKHIENTIENPITANSARNNNDDNIIDAGICYWITGHSMGAGVANLVAASLISSEAIPEISELEGTSDNVYCYTFAAPNTFYRPDNQYSYESRAIPGKNVTGDYREPKGVKYRCIFNIVNDDDFVPKLPMEKCEWTKYGREARLSIEKDLRHKFVKGFAQSYDYSPSEIREENPISELKKKYGTYLVRDYKSNKFAVDSVVALLNGVYDYQYAAPGDKNNMRNETYSYSSRLSKSGNVNYSQSDLNELNENIYYIYIDDLDDFIFEYSRPFQKNDKNIFGYSQKQTPAYLMQSIASAMHTKIKVNGEKREQGKENSFLGTKVKDNQYRFIKTKMAYSGIGAKWSILLSGGPLDALETPHFLESYYSLVKELSTVDFR